MTQVDFYILGSDSAEERLHFVCRLTDKALQRQHQVFLNTESGRMAEQLDLALWTFRAGSFIPHRRMVDSVTQVSEPVIIGHAQEPPAETSDVMINLAVDVPDFFSRYRRVFEVVDGNAERRDQARTRFRFYRERGYELRSHNV